MATDAEIRAKGIKFLPLQKYLQKPYEFPVEEEEIIPDSGIVNTDAFANSGGGGFTGPTGPGSYDSAFDPETQNKQFNEDIGVGTVAEEDDKKGTSLGIVDALRAMGAFTFGGPLNAVNSLRRSNNRNKQKEMDKMNAEIDAKDAKYGISDARLTAGGASQETMDSYENSDGSYSGASTEDYGGGEKDGGFIDGSNRRPFNSGGRTGYFFGGRARLQGGGGADMGAPEKAAERASKGYGTTPDTGSKSGTNDYSSFQQNVNHQKAMRDYQREKPSTLDNAMNLGSELSYLNNLKNLNVLGIVGNIGVNKFRNYLDNKKTKKEEDKLSYNTNPLPTDNYMTDLNATQIKQLEGPQKMGKEYGNFSDQQILDNITPFGDEETAPATLKDVQTFYGSNGGRAMFKNGGLASIL